MDVYNNSLQILEDKNKLTKNDLDDKYKDFKINYSRLYEQLLTTEEFDTNMLKYLCKMLEKKVESNNDLDCDIEVGEKLAKKYIYPQFPEPSLEQKEFIRESLKKKYDKSN